MSESLYKEYQHRFQQIADIKNAANILQWDQEVFLPEKGQAKRAQQIATLTEHAHRLSTDPSIHKLLKDLLNADLNQQQRKNIELSLIDYERSIKLSPEFVNKITNCINKSFYAWIDARKENSFSFFETPLQELIELKKEEAEHLGYEDHPYNAMMNDYDRNLTVATVDKVFTGLKPELDVILEKVLKQPEPDTKFLSRKFPKEDQWKFGIELLEKMGFDFKAGRQDISEHPFTTTFNSGDVRLTTRIDENDFSNMTWSCIHEGGHGLYEQNLRDEEYGLPLGEACSLSIHESQSRIWENNIGRSRSYWKYHFPIAKKYFPEQLNDVDEEQFYKAINRVQPSFIRTESDEITYHFHVMIRYEIEKKLFEGNLKASEIPELWNSLYKSYLGMDVPDDRTGCLQDVHWSHGSFGYFPTYSLGSLYAAQFYNSILKTNTSLENEIAACNFNSIHSWAKQHIYKYGRFYTSEELCLNCTGETLNPEYFLKYVKHKFII